MHVLANFVWQNDASGWYLAIGINYKSKCKLRFFVSVVMLQLIYSIIKLAIPHIFFRNINSPQKYCTFNINSIWYKI